MKSFATGLYIAIGFLGLVGLSDAQSQSGQVNQQSSANYQVEQTSNAASPNSTPQDKLSIDNSAVEKGSVSDEGCGESFSEKAGRVTGKATRNLVHGSEEAWDNTKSSTKDFSKSFKDEYNTDDQGSTQTQSSDPKPPVSQNINNN